MLGWVKLGSGWSYFAHPFHPEASGASILHLDTSCWLQPPVPVCCPLGLRPWTPPLLFVLTSVRDWDWGVLTTNWLSLTYLSLFAWIMQGGKPLDVFLAPRKFRFFFFLNTGWIHYHSVPVRSHWLIITRLVSKFNPGWQTLYNLKGNKHRFFATFLHSECGFAVQTGYKPAALQTTKTSL